MVLHRGWFYIILFLIQLILPRIRRIYWFYSYINLCRLRSSTSVITESKSISGFEFEQDFFSPSHLWKKVWTHFYLVIVMSQWFRIYNSVEVKCCYFHCQPRQKPDSQSMIKIWSWRTMVKYVSGNGPFIYFVYPITLFKNLF